VGCAARSHIGRAATIAALPSAVQAASVAREQEKIRRAEEFLFTNAIVVL
jgi:hypothetical protein